jgi:hypothetical protein
VQCAIDAPAPATDVEASTTGLLVKAMLIGANMEDNGGCSKTMTMTMSTKMATQRLKLYQSMMFDSMMRT